MAWGSVLSEAFFGILGNLEMDALACPARWRKREGLTISIRVCYETMQVLSNKNPRIASC